MDLFGDNLYNLYGSTEVAWATIATPEDLREAPGTAGKPPRGTIVKLFDDDGKPVEQGDTGRIFVGNEMQFEGYTGGGNKDVIEGLMSSGDVGHFDEEGRLFVDGRDDDMIVSGGENVFPQEVEDLLAGHEKIAEAAVFGVDDEEFGQRLKAVVVTKDGAELSEDEVKKYVKSNLAGYKVPRDVEFIDELPRNATGKVLKRELRGGEGRDLAPKLEGMPQRTDIFELGRLGLTSGEGRRIELHVAVAGFDYGGQRYEVEPALVPVRPGRLAHDGQRLGDAPALRGRRSRARACAASSPAELHRRRRRARGHPSRAAATSSSRPTWAEDDELDLEAWARDALALALPGADHLPARLRRPVPRVRREPQRGPRPPARGPRPTSAGRSSPS